MRPSPQAVPVVCCIVPLLKPANGAAPQEELRLRVAGERGAMAALASRAVAEEVLPLLLAPTTGLGARLEAVEADMRCVLGGGVAVLRCEHPPGADWGRSWGR